MAYNSPQTIVSRNLLVDIIDFQLSIIKIETDSNEFETWGQFPLFYFK